MISTIENIHLSSKLLLTPNIWKNAVEKMLGYILYFDLTNQSQVDDRFGK